jgi:hypothetical protein
MPFFGLQDRWIWHGSQEQSQGKIKRLPALGEGNYVCGDSSLITYPLKSPSAELFFGLYTRALLTTTTAIDFFSLLFRKIILIWLVLVQTLSGPVTDPSKLPKWNYDGSSTGQAPGEDSEVIL